MVGRTQSLAKVGGAVLGLSLWITAAATAAWMMLWFLSGDFSSSLLSVLAPMTFLAIWSSESTILQRKNESLPTGPTAPLEG